jgi:hypothetical protein
MPGIGGSSSASQTTQTSSGSGRTLGSKNLYTESGAITVGAKGQYRESGSIGDKATLKFGPDLSGAGGDVSYSYSSSDPEVLKAALDAVQNQTATFTGTMSDLISQANKRAAQTESASLSKLSELALSQATGGQSQANKGVLYIAGGSIVGLILLVLLFRR